MPIELTLSNGGLLDIQPGLPSDYAGPILHGSMASSVNTNLVELVLQELACENYSIRFMIGRLLKRVHASGWINTHGLYSYFMLKNGARKQIDTIGKLHLRQDQYVCFFTEPTDCSAIFEKNKEFRALDFFYSPNLLEELLPFFPELKTVMTASSGLLIPSKVSWALPSMKEITNQILRCPFDEATRQFYFDIKIRELLYQILENAYKRKKGTLSFTPWEIKKIHDARDILETYISRKPPTIKALAKLVALNEFKLKAGFRQYFNTGLFEWLMEHKMQYAKNILLTTNKPIKEVCFMIGYPRSSNFITAFRKRFNMTPGSLRRK